MAGTNGEGRRTGSPAGRGGGRRFRVDGVRGLVRRRRFWLAATAFIAVCCFATVASGTRRLASELIYTSQFGAAGSGAGQFEHPGGVAIDSSGNLWVLDSGNSRIEEFNASGEYVRTVASEGSGNGQLSSPRALALDPSGDVWVADSGNNRVEEFGPEGEFVKVVGDEESPEEEQVGHAEGIAVDASGNVWVSATSKSKLIEFSNGGSYLGTAGATGPESQQLGEPEGIAIANGHVWVADWTKQRVEEFDEEGAYLSVLGTAGSEEGQLETPYAIATGEEGAIWIGDPGNDRLEQFNEAGEYLGAIGTRGSEAGEFELDYPIGLAITGEEVLWVTDSANNRLEKWAPGVAEAPAATAAPTVEGELLEGKTLHASHGEWTGTRPMTFAFQWRRCNEASCANIGGATYADYELGAEDVGDTLEVRVTATNGAGSAESSSSPTSTISAPTAPSVTVEPVISGVLEVGHAVSASTGSWAGAPAPTFAYQWEACNPRGSECEDLSQATASSYRPGIGDLAGTLRVRVTATNSAGSASSTSEASSEVQAGPPVEVSVPQIAGPPRQGSVLRLEPGTWVPEDAEQNYQWRRCSAEGDECVNIESATGPEYEVQEADLGSTLRVLVGASNVLGSVTALSPATSVISTPATLLNTFAPVIAGVPQQGRLLSGNPGSWVGIAFIEYSYTWLRCDTYGAACSEVAIGASHTASEPDVGHTLRLSVRASEVEGSATEVSSSTPQVAAEAAPVPASAPGISGTGLPGMELSVTAGGWSEEDPPTSYSYAWERCDEDGANCSEIGGATEAIYLLTGSDAGHSVRAVVTATDATAHTTAGPSAPVAVAPEALADASAPAVTGAAVRSETLTAAPGIWTAPGGLTYTYEWQRCDSEGHSCEPIPGASESIYSTGEADVGSTIGVIVTATSGTESASAESPLTAVVAASAGPPEDVVPPTLEGYATTGESVSASTGLWRGGEPISYSYQWQSCSGEGTECADGEGATGSSYTLPEAAEGTTVRVIVTATNTWGEATSASATTEDILSPAAPEAQEQPEIIGKASVKERLYATNGSWSGTRPLSYLYQWQRCNAAGEACEPIEGATEPSYEVAEADLGAALRVQVTTKNTLGEASASSAPLPVEGTPTAGVAQAIETAEETDPSIIEPSTAATLEEEEVQPAIGDVGEAITSTSALTSASVSKETPGEFGVNTPNGELSITPIANTPDPTPLATIINGAAAIFANTANDTDTLVRPTALGAMTLLQLRSSSAPRSFTWEVRLGAEQTLETLPGGGIAVVEPSTGSVLEEGIATESEVEESETPGSEEEGADEELADEELQSGVESSEGPFEEFPAATLLSTEPTSPTPGELHPQNTKTNYEAGAEAMAEGESEASGRVLMVIQAPEVRDATGASVPASLSAEGDTMTLTLSPEGGTSYPVTASVAATGHTNTTSKATGPELKYGFSDNLKSAFTPFDTLLKEGPLKAKLARLVINYNTNPNSALIKEWLKAVSAAGLQPMITLQQCAEQAASYKEQEEGHRRPCPANEPAKPSPGQYYKRVKALMKRWVNGSLAEGIKPVRVWGAWNEPDHKGNVYAKPNPKGPPEAATLWGEAEHAAEVICKRHCKIVVIAGEFAEDLGHHEYVEYYERNLLRREREHKFPAKRKPAFWGLHDYADLIAVGTNPGAVPNRNAHHFPREIDRTKYSPHVWLTEQGVQLEGGIPPKGRTRLYGNATLQTAAARDFFTLAHESPRIERVFYYGYRGPTKAAVEHDETKGLSSFDSALVGGDGTLPENERPAYCVIARAENGCTLSADTGAPVRKETTLTATTVSVTVDPEGSTASYWVDYGTTSSYGSSTETTMLPNADGRQSETVHISGLSPCTTYHYAARAESASVAGEPVTGADHTFTTRGCPAVQISAGFFSGCVVVEGGRLECWGETAYGDLGAGPDSSFFETLPEPVQGITTATAVSIEDGHACAVLSNKHVMCWGNNGAGQLGDGTIANRSTPVDVQGITDAVDVAAGDSATCALLTTGHVKCWGNASSGQLGTGSIEGESRTPVSVIGVSNATAISAGGSSACALLETGHVKCWGQGKSEEGLYSEPTPTEVEGISTATSVAQGLLYTCVTLTSGSVKCWGNNNKGQLGDGTTSLKMTPTTVSGITNATAVAAASWHTCALLTSGHVKCFGENESGQLGDGTTTNSTTPVEVSGLSGVQEISTASAHSCALASEGALYCWGSIVGNGEYGDYPTPVQVDV